MPEDGPEDPLLDCAFGALLDEEVDTEVEEGEADAVIAAAFGAEHMSQPARYPSRETALGEHASRQHRVRWGQTRADDEGRLEPRAQNGVDESGRHEPAERHDGPQHHADALPVAGEVTLGQLDADGEALQRDDQPRRLLGDVVGEPLEGADEVGASGAKGDADEGG